MLFNNLTEIKLSLHPVLCDIELPFALVIPILDYWHKFIAPRCQRMKLK